MNSKLPPEPVASSSVLLDLANQCLWQGTETIPLTPKAFAVLRYLMAHPGQLVTKEDLLNAAWPGIYVSDAALKVCIRRLRQALGDLSHPPQYIETVHWRGYRLITPIATTTSPVAGSSLQVADSQKVHSPKSKGQNRSSVDNNIKLDTRNKKSDTPLVGRETELEYLHGRLKKAQSGERQFIFVTGEPGIGKTTVIEAFLTQAGE